LHRAAAFDELDAGLESGLANRCNLLRQSPFTASMAAGAWKHYQPKIFRTRVQFYCSM
jgi:hypothetical protein